MSVRLLLAIDNCFAAKRWCEAGEWMRLIGKLGIRYVEASADNEIDPLYSCASHINDWLAAVQRESGRTGVRVVNLYSGHGTYSTLGLGHYDSRVRDHIARNWVRPMLRIAGKLRAGLGFYAHAFPENVLEDPDRYAQAYDALIDILQDLSVYALRRGVRTLGVEQMYTPHQIPWTIAGAAEFLRRANDKHAGAPVYLTIDTGHQIGQRRFCAPGPREIEAFVKCVRNRRPSSLYVGPAKFYRTFESMALKGAATIDIQHAVAAHVRAFPHLFSSHPDGDPYEWLRRLGAFSPIIHLQQTDGHESVHRNFTAAHNAHGLISAEKVLAALRESFAAPAPAGFPPKVARIYLTLEPFLPTACHSRIVLDEIAESISYWRRFVHEDGIELMESREHRIRAKRTKKES